VTAVAPEQVQQAVVVLRRHDRHSLGFGRLGESEIHLEPGRQLLSEVTLQRVPCGRQPRKMKNGALHGRSAGLLGGMLIQRHDIGPGRGQEGADGRHQPRLVGAAHQ